MTECSDRKGVHDMRGSTKAILTVTGLAVFAIAAGNAYYYSHPVLQAKHRLKQFVRHILSFRQGIPNMLSALKHHILPVETPVWPWLLHPGVWLL